MAEVMSRENIKRYHWFNRYVNADGREKVRTYNVRKYLEKNVAVEIGNVKSKHAIARVKFRFYVRFYFLRGQKRDSGNPPLGPTTFALYGRQLRTKYWLLHTGSTELNI